MLHRSTPPASFTVEGPTGTDDGDLDPREVVAALRAGGHEVPHGFTWCAPWCAECERLRNKADRNIRRAHT